MKDRDVRPDSRHQVLLLPKDTNAHGTIFGGVILSHIDLASAIEARTIAAHRYVTRAMREVEFHEPVFVGDIVCFYTELVRVGHTSVTIRVTVEAERWGTAGADGDDGPRGSGQGDRGGGRAGGGQRSGTADPIRPEPLDGEQPPTTNHNKPKHTNRP